MEAHMNHGRSIKLFLVDGTPNGLLTAEIVNWTGHVITGPRSKLSELIQRPECGRTGIYFLIGPGVDGGIKPQVYIGETDDIGTRLKQHNRLEDKGGKDFWEKVCLITSKDQNLTKAHVKYLESVLMKIARDIGRCTLLNNTAHSYTSLPESDRADMKYFVEQVQMILPVLGLDFLRNRPGLRKAESDSATDGRQDSPRFTAKIPRSKVMAYGQEIDGEFVVLKNSSARHDWLGEDGGYSPLFKQLCDDGVLIEDGKDLRTFVEDYAFSSPSAAASIVAGRPSNGRVHWRVEETGQKYADWQDQQVAHVTDAH